MARKLGRRRGGRAPSPTGKQGRRIPTGLREGGPQGPPTGWMLLKALGVPDTNATRHAPKMTRMTPRVAHTPSGGGFDGSIATKSMEGVRWRGSSSTFSFLCFFRRDLCFLRGPSPRSGVVSVISFDSMPAAPPPRLQGAQLHIRVAKRVLPQDTSKSRPVARLLLLARRSGPAGCCGALLVSCCARGHTQRHARAVIPGLKSIQIVMVSRSRVCLPLCHRGVHRTIPVHSNEGANANSINRGGTRHYVRGGIMGQWHGMCVPAIVVCGLCKPVRMRPKYWEKRAESIWVGGGGKSTAGHSNTKYTQ